MIISNKLTWSIIEQTAREVDKDAAENGNRFYFIFYPSRIICKYMITISLSIFSVTMILILYKTINDMFHYRFISFYSTLLTNIIQEK